jgi:glutathionylspermidine synthase
MEKDISDLNNFHLWFLDENRRDSKDDQDRILVRALDQIVEEKGFDRERLRSLNVYIKTEVGEDLDRYLKERDELLLPIYFKMLSLGYNPKELIT